MHAQTILITGASSGIGKATALQLAAKGANLVLAARNYAALTQLVSEVRMRGGNAIAVPTDVTQRAQVADLVSEANAAFGVIHALVNCAGVGILKPAPELSEADLDEMYAVNVKGLIFVTALVAAEMAKGKGGKVVTPVGTMGRFVMRGSTGYSASKWAAVGALKAMATEWQRQGVGFSLLYLGGVDTPFWDRIDMKVQREKMLTADDAARAIVYALEAAPNGMLNEMTLQPESHQLL
jgi:NADP-dependent 3-hydroxy acid dehydrogenase YdfG